MHRHAVLGGVVAACILAAAVGLGTYATAQDATPAGGTEDGVVTLVLLEHNDNITEFDQSPLGPSAGDMLVWGPNPLYDEANAEDTGATTQGTCIALHSAPDCHANETIVFPDGGTLEIQGIEAGNAAPSARTIVAGSGRYRGATGTVKVSPTADGTVWTKTFEIVMPGVS